MPNISQQTTAIQVAKKNIRLKMREKRAALTPYERETRQKQLLQVFQNMDVSSLFFSNRSVSSPTSLIFAGYQAWGDELNPAALMAQLDQQGYSLALPCILDEELMFRAYTPASPLKKGCFGIEEPLDEAAMVSPHIILTPLLAFDQKGERLGYGKGFYDRVFMRFPDALRLGLAYSFQEVEYVPSESHDIKLHAVLTDQALIFTP